MLKEASISSPMSHMRGVSPLIRGHLRNRSHQKSDIFNMTTMHGGTPGDLESNLRSISKELKNPRSKKSLNSTMVRKILQKSRKDTAS